MLAVVAKLFGARGVAEEEGEVAEDVLTRGRDDRGLRGLGLLGHGAGHGGVTGGGLEA